jgi:hypothetical protein
MTASPFTASRTSRFAPQGPGEQFASDVGAAGGGVLGSLVPFGAYGRFMPQGASGQQFVSSVLAQPVAPQVGAMAAGNVVGTQTGDPSLGIATTLAAPLAMGGAQRIVQAPVAADTQEAERRALLNFGQTFGGKQTAGKILGSPKLQAVESRLSAYPLPYLGGKGERVEQANRNAWQSRILQTIGTTGETAATPGVLDTARTRIGGRFDAAVANAPPMNIYTQDADGGLDLQEHPHRPVEDCRHRHRGQGPQHGDAAHPLAGRHRAARIAA